MGRAEARSGRLEAREPMPTAPEATRSKEIGAKTVTPLTVCPEKSGVAKEASRSRKANNLMKKRGLYDNINARKKAGTSRPKSKSTIAPKVYKQMKAKKGKFKP